jgi:hypothetical protein
MRAFSLTHLALLLSLITAGCRAGPGQPDLAASSSEQSMTEAADDFSVDFRDCVESIGVGLVPIERARALVPSPFVLAGEGQPVTPFVARTSRCQGIAVAGQEHGPVAIVQIGAIIVPPDGTGDINSALLWYFTDDGLLASSLVRIGLAAQHVQNIGYDLGAAGDAFSFQVDVPLPGDPRLTIAGTVTPSSLSAGSFRANWWARPGGRTVKMDTLVPVIDIGGASLTLATDAGSSLGGLIGGSSIGFPIVQQFNGFATANLKVSIAP